MAAVRGGRWRMSVRTIRLLPDIPVRLRSMKSPRLTLKRDISRVKNPSKGWKFPWTPVSSFVAGTLFGFVADQFYHESWENLSGILTSGNFVQKLAARTTSGSGFDPPDSGNLPRSKRFNFVAEAVDIAAPAVVYIEVTTRGRGWHSFRGPSSSGSGFIVAENGLVLTNAHVVQDAVGVTVRLQDGRQFSGSVVDIDPSSDLAAIRLNAGEVRKRFSRFILQDQSFWKMSIPFLEKSTCRKRGHWILLGQAMWLLYEFLERERGGGGGGTPIYFLYRDVPPDRV